MSAIISVLLTCWNTDGRKHHLVAKRLNSIGLDAPHNLDKIWRREPLRYVAAAIIAVNQRGE